MIPSTSSPFQASVLVGERKKKGKKKEKGKKAPFQGGPVSNLALVSSSTTSQCLRNGGDGREGEKKREKETKNDIPADSRHDGSVTLSQRLLTHQWFSHSWRERGEGRGERRKRKKGRLGLYRSAQDSAILQVQVAHIEFRSVRLRQAAGGKKRNKSEPSRRSDRAAASSPASRLRQRCPAVAERKKGERGEKGGEKRKNSRQGNDWHSFAAR